MMNTRRAFLFGRRTPASNWGQFCRRLSRSCVGTVSWQDDDHQQARLIPAREQDLIHALALCREFGVRMALWTDPQPVGIPHPVLWVEPGRAWARIVPIEPTQMAWRVDAGCQMAELQALSFSLAQGVEPSWSVAQWLASAQSSRWPIACGAQSGILRAEILMHDGSRESLGPFGASASEPLRSLTMQRMVPGLFQLLHSTSLAGLAQGKGPAPGYRLDAMIEAPSQDINLARLLAGHGGSLCWLLAVWLHRKPEGVSVARPHDQGRLSLSAAGEMDAVDEQIKQLFDPSGVFLPVPFTKR